MGVCPLVRPETVRVTLKNGEWLELVKELTAGEYRDVQVAHMKEVTAGSGVVVDYRNVGFAMVLAYVKDWSFTNFDGTTLPISSDWLRKFRTDLFDDVRAAVEAHHSESEKAVEELKNEPAGAATT